MYPSTLTWSSLLNQPLSGLRVLILEDEFLIAMDVEQLCRENGAAEVSILRNLRDLDGHEFGERPFDVAVVDLMLSGASTLGFARVLHDRGTPFVFASGYSDVDDIRQNFPGVALVGKPYAGDELISAIAAAARR